METEIGKVTHYYGKIGVGVVSLADELRVGDTVHIVGKRTDFTQKVNSLQAEHEGIPAAGKGQEVGLKVDQPVRTGDIVYKVSE